MYVFVDEDTKRICLKRRSCFFRKLNLSNEYSYRLNVLFVFGICEMSAVQAVMCQETYM